MERNISTVAFRSNLYPVTESCQTDSVFQSKIRDPFSLEILKKRGHVAVQKLTDIQEQEYRSASVHCAYAAKDDYPWGTILDSDGCERVVCRCLNIECRWFQRCRPDFDISELEVLEENKLVQPAIFKFGVKLQEITENDSGITELAAKLFESSKQKLEPTEIIDKSEELQVVIDTVPFELPVVLEVVPQHVKTTKVDFRSFVESSQEKIIEAIASNRGIVNAGPGTGKTWTLIEKIIFMINNELTEAENILVLCFSRSAVEVIKTRLSAAAKTGRIGYEWQDVDVRTFDSFATAMLVWVQDNHPELLPQGFQLEEYNYDARIRTATSIMKKHNMLEEYEHIIIDEVQDLVSDRAELVLALLQGLPKTCGFTLLGDSCQSLYDYIVAENPNAISSERFYQEIFNSFPSANYYALIENHRQGDKLGLLSVPYRKAILTGTAQERTHVAAGLFADIPQLSWRLQDLTQSEIMRYKHGTLGLLTRTNGQALQISSWLRNNEIPHTLQRALGAPLLGDWISKLFCNYENETIDEATFIAKHLAMFPEINYGVAKERWVALVSTQHGESKSRHEISDLLRGLLRYAKESALYQSNSDRPYTITVSNIHRAKGKEFDSVIVIDDVIEAMTNSENQDVLEHKVCYVALTRPKRNIERVSIPTQYIYIAKNEKRRCSKAMIRKKYINNFEVGMDDDLEVKSFALTQDAQEYIQNKLVPGTSLRLIKCPKDTKSYIVYAVVAEEAEHIILGYTSESFADELESAIQRILKITKSIKYEVFPHAFCDIYVDSLTTCISAAYPFPINSKPFGGISVWTGMAITGFATVDKDTY